jgi:hypothetical protein
LERCGQAAGGVEVDGLDECLAKRLDQDARFPVVVFANGRLKLVTPVEVEKKVTRGVEGYQG